LFVVENVNPPLVGCADGDLPFWRAQGDVAVDAKWGVAADPLLGLVVGIAIASMAQSLPEGGREPWNTLGVFAFFAIVGTLLWLFLEIGFLPGTPGPNRFGPDPLGQSKNRKANQIADY
jgi:hypothetical protein